MKVILVAIDFTEYSQFAVDSAASLSRQTGASVHLLHIVDRPLVIGDESYDNYHNVPGGPMVMSGLKRKLDTIADSLKLRKIKVVYEIRGDVFNAILEYSDNNQVDLIVMGAYGSTGDGRSFIGSNTERVMRHAKVPVLIVKESFSEFTFKSMVLASEFYGEVYNVFPKIKEIIDLFQPKIHLLKVNTPSRFQRTHNSLELMASFAIKFSLGNHTKNIYNDLTIVDGIINFTKSIEADIIAITPDGQWRLADIFKKNTTDALMKGSSKAILSVKTKLTVRTTSEMFFGESPHH